MRKTVLYLVLFAFALVFSSCRVVVVEHTGHPAYLLALSDLRVARAYLNKVTDSDVVAQQELDTIGSINTAIAEIKKAAIDDGKNIRNHPAIEMIANRQSRFSKAIELLRSARMHINKVESNPSAVGLKDMAIRHINNALHTLVTHFRILYPSIKINVVL